jgi:hypothetical protein
MQSAFEMLAQDHKIQRKERRPKNGTLTIVLPTKSQAKYCAFLCFAGVI